MTKILKSAVLWQLLGGFVLGTAGIVAIQPAAATRSLTQHVATVTPFSG